MNIRKNIDYSTMFAALEAALSAEMPQMQLCCELGRIVCSRPEKGAAVAAAEYLHSRFPDVSGFSPRKPFLFAGCGSSIGCMRTPRVAEAGHGDQLDAECSHSGSRHGAGGAALVSSCRWSFRLVKGRTPEKNRFCRPSGNPTRRI